jgi:hypothetical protein
MRKGNELEFLFKNADERESCIKPFIKKEGKNDR